MKEFQEEEGQIVIYGAREHNLKNIDLTIPRNSLTVITGLSGSGKSSLAFDTIYADSVGIWRLFRPMPVSFWEGWNVRTSIKLQD